MNVTTTINKGKNGKTVTARSGNRRKTVPWTPGIPGGVAANHGIAARALVAKVVPAHRRAEIQNTAKVVSFTSDKVSWFYKD
jgi:hypothetical protein